MADNKQYVTQQLDNGNVMISEDVIATVVAHAVTDVEGIVGLSTKPGAEVISKKNWGKGIKIVIGQQDELYIDCNVIVSYGQGVVAVAKAAQEAVANALESIAGVKIAAVNINVSGIVRQ